MLPQCAVVDLPVPNLQVEDLIERGVPSVRTRLFPASPGPRPPSRATRTQTAIARVAFVKLPSPMVMTTCQLAPRIDEAVDNNATTDSRRRAALNASGCSRLDKCPAPERHQLRSGNRPVQLLRDRRRRYLIVLADEHEGRDMNRSEERPRVRSRHHRGDRAGNGLRRVREHEGSHLLDEIAGNAAFLPPAASGSWHRPRRAVPDRRRASALSCAPRALPACRPRPACRPARCRGSTAGRDEERRTSRTRRATSRR